MIGIVCMSVEGIRDLNRISELTIHGDITENLIDVLHLGSSLRIPMSGFHLFSFFESGKNMIYTL